MSAQRRSATSNRRARGAAARKSAGRTPAESTVEASASPAVAVAEPVVKTASPARPAPRMAATRDQGGGRRNERIEGVRRYLTDTRAELRRVTWPDQITLRNLTIVVIAVSAAMGLLLGGIDFVLLKVFEAL